MLNKLNQGMYHQIFGCAVVCLVFNKDEISKLHVYTMRFAFVYRPNCYESINQTIDYELIENIELDHILRIAGWSLCIFIAPRMKAKFRLLTVGTIGSCSVGGTIT